MRDVIRGAVLVALCAVCSGCVFSEYEPAPSPVFVERTGEGLRMSFPICSGDHVVILGVIDQVGDEYHVLRHEGRGLEVTANESWTVEISDDILRSGTLTDRLPLVATWSEADAPTVAELDGVGVETPSGSAGFVPRELNGGGPWLVWGEDGARREALIAPTTEDAALAEFARFCE